MGGFVRHLGRGQLEQGRERTARGWTRACASRRIRPSGCVWKRYAALPDSIDNLLVNRGFVAADVMCGRRGTASAAARKGCCCGRFGAGMWLPVGVRR